MKTESIHICVPISVLCPPKKTVPMNQLASPVKEWGAPGAYPRSKGISPHKVPGTMGDDSSSRSATGTTRTNLYRTTRRGRRQSRRVWRAAGVPREGGDSPTSFRASQGVHGGGLGTRASRGQRTARVGRTSNPEEPEHPLAASRSAVAFPRASGVEAPLCALIQEMDKV